MVDMEGNNVIVYAVVGIIIGAIIGVGVGYVMWNGGSDDNTTDPNTETYSYYLYFGADDQRTGWYSAEGTDAATAFDSAMKAADIEYTVSSYGYIGSIGGEDGATFGWFIAQYLYEGTTYEDAVGSITGVETTPNMTWLCNGWKTFSGYGTGSDFQLGLSGSTIFFMSPYDASFGYASPDEVSGWMTTGPFATA